MSMSLIKLYLEEQMRVIRDFPVQSVAELCWHIVWAYDEGKTVYMAANGGPAGFCANFATDLALHPFVSDDKSRPVPENVRRMKVVDLTASPSTLTGIMNDFGRDFVFSQQLEGHVGEGDRFIGFSGSGNSANIIEAIRVARKSGAHTVAITRGSGGKCRNEADLCIIIPGTSTFPGQTGGNDNNFHFEDAVSSISHMVVGLLQRHVREKYGIS